MARSASQLQLYGDDIEVTTQVDSWLTFTIGQLANHNEFKNALNYLESVLAPITFLVANRISIADYILYGALYTNGHWQGFMQTGKEFANITRWYKFIESRDEVQSAVKSLPKDINIKATKYEETPATLRQGKATKGDNQPKQAKDEGKFIDLPGAEMGKVTVRFPPEASGYLHVGHAKAALLNQHYQQHFQGKLIMRFDDTNPAKEKEEYEDVILEDLKMLRVKYDHFSRTSDHFEIILGYCEKLIKDGNAYVDDTDAETMKAERETRTESRNRSNPVAQNLKMWEEMKKATASGLKCAVRAKMNMKSDNGCLRDPTIYRCKPESHPHTGDKYKVYPTYDFACPIVDSIEGVTHCLRTTEYMDRDDQFFWFIDALGLRRPHIWAYARLNLTNTVMSKRKLTWLVDEGIVEGWDDPRLPTVRGVLRRGLTVDALKMFIIAQGSSRSVVFMEWDKIWAMNKKVIDPVAPRLTSVDKAYHVEVRVKDVKAESVQADKHPKDPEVGKKTIWRGPILVIDGVDAETLKEGENTTFINWGNLKIDKIHKSGNKVTAIDATPDLSNMDFKKTLKVTWLAKVDNEASAKFTPTVCTYFDHIITKPVLDRNDEFKDFVNRETRTDIDMLGDPELRHLKKGDVIQLQRRGFFIVDQPYQGPSPNICKPSPIRLISIPDGSVDSYGPPGKKATPAPQPTKSKGKAEKKEPAKKEESKKKSAEPQPPTKADDGQWTTKAVQLNDDIEMQGEKVRTLKGQKAEKEAITTAVQVLLGLKTKFKAETGLDWKQGMKPPQPAAADKSSCLPPPSAAASSGASNADQVNDQIVAQGNKVRDLKGNKADKAEITAAVAELLSLKTKYKEITGKDWKPNAHQPSAPQAVPSAAASSGASNADQINDQIVAQGNKVRDLKGKKANKAEITAAVAELLSLKTKYKEITGTDWKPDVHQPSAALQAVSSSVGGGGNNTDQLNEQITNQGQKVRALKDEKADKATVGAAVTELLLLKAKYKEATGNDWKPEATPAAKKQSPPKQVSSGDPGDKLNEDIAAQCAKVRDLKGKKADKAEIDAAVAELLALKAKFKEATGHDWKPPSGGNDSGKKADNKKKAKKEQEKKPSPAPQSRSGQKGTRLGMEAKKEDNLADWYSQIIIKAEMLEYYDVSGCYILRPWSYSIWERIQIFFDAEIKKLGVENCYFPIFVSQAALQREKDHIADFAPEVAWVTKSGDSELAEPIAIRPTSETVMYPAYAKWIQSHRDLPLKLNQWNNVVRWEFKHPQPFLRTREFLWQEGHTAFATFNEAKEEVMTILDLYRQIYEDLLAIPVIRGKKTEKEKFAGGVYTTTVEAYIAAAGRAIQGGTSHHLGQNFSKMFEIVFEDPDSGEKKYVYQNSWGITTRTLGVLTMVHGDNHGLVLPPRVASIQVVIVPCGITASLNSEDRKSLYDACNEYEKALVEAGVRVRGDYRENYSPGWKFNHWELKGVPLRMELGPRDVKNSQVVLVKRYNGEKLTEKKAGLMGRIQALLEDIQASMFARAKKELDDNVVVAKTWDQFVAALDKSKLIQAPFCGIEECEDQIKDMSKADVDVEVGAPSMGAKSLCIPFQQPGQLDAKQKCVRPGCANPPQFYTLFGRSY
jgi:bifunctional glutamyl/prolyl-tRNA synthetase